MRWAYWGAYWGSAVAAGLLAAAAGFLLAVGGFSALLIAVSYWR